jgi:hypothetical protein
LKVPRQWPLVLLVEARLAFGICSILIFKDVGGAVVGRIVVLATIQVGVREEKTVEYHFRRRYEI